MKVTYKIPRERSKYRRYTIQQLVAAAELVKVNNVSIYQAAKQMDVPWSTLRDYLNRNMKDSRDPPKLGSPFALTPDLEIELYNYTIKKQELFSD